MIFGMENLHGLVFIQTMFMFRREFSSAERFFEYKFGTRNIDFSPEALISVPIFTITRPSVGM